MCNTYLEICRYLLENPESYSGLLKFYLQKRGPARLDPVPLTEADLSYEGTLGGGLPHMEITHPAGCFSQFLNYFGEKIFALWRFALLRKRILFFSQPPIGS